MVLHKRWQPRFWVPLFICFVGFLHGNDGTERNKQKNVLTIDLFSEKYIHDIEAWVPGNTVIEDVTFESDVYMQDDEFHDLVGIGKNSLLTAHALKSAISNLKKKNKFRTVSVLLKPGHHQGSMLHLQLEGLWTFKKIKFHGPMIQKDRLRQYYLFEPSEPFDVQKHYHFIGAIKQALEDDGYCNPVVADYLQYDRVTKSVTVHCVLDQGAVFRIDSVVLNSTNSSLPTMHHCALLKKMAKKVRSRLQGVRYALRTVEREQEWLCAYALKKGFPYAAMVVKKNSDVEHAAVTLSLEIDLGEKRLFSFVGNTFLSSAQLLDHLVSLEGSSYTLPSFMLKEELMDVYKKNGFWSVAIDSQHHDEQHCFVISEGARMSLGRVVMQGVESFDPEMVVKKFFEQVKSPLYFDGDSFKQAVNKMVAFYAHEGFWDCAVLKQNYVPSATSEVYDAHIIIDEGQRRYLVSLAIPDFPELMLQGPFAPVGEQLPIPFDLEMIAVQRQWLIQHFQRQGYLYVQVKPSPQEDQHHKNKFSLSWQVDLCDGPVTFGKTIVAGSCTFPIKNIMRQLHYKQGDLWDKGKLDQSVMDLRRLGIFESVYMYPDAISQPEAEKTIIIKLVEDDPFEVRVRAGFQQVSKNLTFRRGSTYKIGGSLLYKNPCNVADYFRIDGDLTRFYRYLSGEYFRPWIFDLPINMALKGYSNKYTQPVRIGTDKPLYQATQEGALLGLTYPIGRSKIGTNIGLEYMETSGLSRDLARAINFEPSLVDRKVPYIFFEPNVFIDLLDDKLNPTRGSLTIISFKGMFSWYKGSVNFFKMMCEQSFFIPYNPVVVGVRFRFGTIFNQRLSAIMPPERFYLGGPYSLRGYEIDQAPPLGIFVDDRGNRCLVAQGGKSMFNGNVEVRFPIYDHIGGTIFQDFGVLIENSLAEITGNKLLAATGFGVRYNTPIGPLRFDIGWKWKRRKPEKSLCAWFLTLGNAF